MAEPALAELLVSIGIAEEPGAGYAALLVEDGFDTPAAFNEVSLDELKEDFGFKRGHLRMVEKSRGGGGAPAAEAAAAPPSAAAAPLSGGDTPPRPRTPRRENIPDVVVEDASAIGQRIPAVSTAVEPFKGTRSNPGEAPPAASEANSAAIGPARTIFGSMRFPVPEEARALAAVLKACGIFLKIVDLRPGADISTEVFAWIEFAHTFLVFGTANYGEETDNPACSCAEAKYAQNLGKRVILIRMIQWDQHFEHLQARVMFGMNKLTLFWMPGTPLDPEIVTAFVDALDPEKIVADDDALFRAVSTPQLPQSSSAESGNSSLARQLSTASDFASISGSSVEELLTFSGSELKELMKEQ